MRFVFQALGFLFILCGIASHTWAKNEVPQPIQELFLTEAVYPQDEGEIQLTLLPAYRNSPSRERGEIPITVEFGLTDSWQIEAGWTMLQFATEPTTAGIGNFELGTLYSFMDIGGTLTHAAVGFEIEAPLGDVNRNLSDGLLEYESAFILAKDFPSLNGTQIFSQWGLNLVQRVKSPDNANTKEPAAHSFSWNSGFFIPFGDLVYTQEFNWTTNEWNHNGQENEWFVTPGLIWSPIEETWFGIGIPVGLNNDADDFRVVL